MKKPINLDDGDQCWSLGQELLKGIVLDDLTEAHMNHPQLAEVLRTQLVKLCELGQEAGCSQRDFGLLLILNGIGCLGGQEQKERESQSN